MVDEFTLFGLLTPVYKMTTLIFNKRLFNTLSKVNKLKKEKSIQLFIQNIKK